jgi:putative DNA methylase
MASRKELLAQEVTKAVGAGKAVALETVDFNDPNRPKTCLEVDFPLVSINEIASLEAASGASKKPIYQMSKWWARRQSSVFRSMLIAAATKAPEDSAHAAKTVWDNYYANHQKKGSFKDLKVADIFMGGGTTIIEGSRLGMQVTGNDLNPVAWFVVKQELSNTSMDKVSSLLADIEAYVKPQITPYFYCDGPNGEKGKWTYLPENRVLPDDFDPLEVDFSLRHEYGYEGPESVYTFWAKHGPCQVTGCGHRTPIMSSPIIAIKTLTTKFWEHKCRKCNTDFHIEEESLRLAPDAPQYVAPSEIPFSTLDRKKGAVCPHCGHSELLRLAKGKNKKVELTLLVHPSWLQGSPKQDSHGNALGGSAQDEVNASIRWNLERASHIRLLEVRGKLPPEVSCPQTNLSFRTDVGTVPKRSNYACGACGTVQDVLATVKASGKAGPVAAYAFQGYSAKASEAGAANSGRFFAPFGSVQARQYNAALSEWQSRKDADLSEYWPKSNIPYGFMTGIANGDIREGHGLTHWWTLFNPRQLLVNSLFLKSICETGGDKHDRATREFVLGAFQQFVRCNTNLSIWHMRNNQISAALSNSNFHPKSTNLEPSPFSTVGDGNWKSAIRGLPDAMRWSKSPWELVSNTNIERIRPDLKDELSGKSEKIQTGDPVPSGISVSCGSSTDLSYINDGSCDLVITDPPFGGLLHYSELSDFFYVWLRLALKGEYPEYFGPDYTPKSLEAVANRAREPDDADGFYKRLLTQCWREAHRILKPGGILAFTFHHSEDEPWVAVLESLFDAGYYLEATYPIRSDETKGDGEFGSKTIEYDIIHVCRKRTEEPTPVSWGRMRREVMADVRQLQGMLENHAKEGLPAADIQVIRRGKALEYFSRHYGKVYVDEGRTISVKDALVGINQLIDEDADKGKEPPPVNAEPITRQFLRTFGTATEMKRDQLQKFLKGSITTPDEFEQRGWCSEKSKVFTRVNPLDFARDWSGRHKRRLTSDLDQALVLIGSCFDSSGINTSDTLKNENFKPHVALKPLLEWMQRNGPDLGSRNAASRAVTIYNSWAASQAIKPQQGSLFEEYEL